MRTRPGPLGVWLFLFKFLCAKPLILNGDVEITVAGK